MTDWKAVGRRMVATVPLILGLVGATWVIRGESQRAAEHLFTRMKDNDFRHVEELVDAKFETVNVRIEGLEETMDARFQGLEDLMNARFDELNALSKETR